MRNKELFLLFVIVTESECYQYKDSSHQTACEEPAIHRREKISSRCADWQH